MARLSAPFSVSPAVNVATGVRKLTFPQNLQSAFFRCVATNEMESDDYVMRFLGGRLIYFFHLNILDWLAWEYSRLSSLLAPNVPSGDEWREQLYSPAAARQVLQICLFVCLILSTLYYYLVFCYFFAVVVVVGIVLYCLFSQFILQCFLLNL